MKIAVMQPYFLPYIGYFQLISAVDKFVFFDDVNYINRGWINRNRILLNNQPHFFTLPVAGASQNQLINQLDVQMDDAIVRKKLSTIRHAYGKAPYFDQVFELLKKIFENPETNLSCFVINSLKGIAGFLGIQTDFLVSSELEKFNQLKGQQKILQICKMLNASHYINPIGGVDMYASEVFEKHNISLSFIKTNSFSYKQFNDRFEPNLSIIDVLMFNSVSQCRGYLENYQFVPD